MSFLEKLLLEDGIHLPQKGGAEKMIRCFSPNHDDRTASMSVNVAKDRYHCFGCGLAGGPYTYLTEIRQLSSKQAMELLDKRGAPKYYTRAEINQRQEKETSNKRQPKKVTQIPRQITNKGITKNLVGQYDYTTYDGEILFCVARYEWDNSTGKRSKSFLQFTKRRTAEGWWTVGPTNSMLPEIEKLDILPLYNIANAVNRVAKAVEADRRVQIWVVEGEKCAEIARRVTKKDGKPMNPVVVSPCGGSSKRVEATDWSPLYGQKVLVWADADEAGRKFSRAVGKHLFENQCEVKFVMPPGDDGYDIADAISIGGWEKLMQFLEASGGAQTYDKVINPKTIDLGEKVPTDRMASTEYFKVLGMVGDRIAIQNKKTHKIHTYMPGSMISEGVLLQIAPASFWDAIAGGIQWTSSHKRAWIDAIVRAAEKGGELDLNNVVFWRRGARFFNDGEGKKHYMYHCGNKLIYSSNGRYFDIERDLSNPMDKEIYLPCPSISMREEDDASMWGNELAKAVLRYRWLTRDHGATLLGWMVTSLIGGALRFRPAVWLTAAPGTGKTFVINNILKPIFGDLVMTLSNTTEAGMAAISTDSALPAMLDEFEPGTGKYDAQSGVLDLLRIATSGEGVRLRGKADGGTISTRPRFSLFMSSVNRPELSDANLQRIMPIKLAMQGVSDWLEVESAIEEATKPHKCESIRTHIIRHTPQIAEHAHEIEKEYVKLGIPTREAQIKGSLSAGMAFITRDPGYRLGLVREDENNPFGALATMLAQKVRIPPNNDKSLAEALQIGFNSHGEAVEELNPYVWNQHKEVEDNKIWADLCRRSGLMIQGQFLAVAEKHPAHKNFLRESSYKGMDFDQFVRNLPGAIPSRTESGQRQRLTFGPAKYRSTLIPRKTIEDAGFYLF